MLYDKMVTDTTVTRRLSLGKDRLLLLADSKNYMLTTLQARSVWYVSQGPILFYFSVPMQREQMFPYLEEDAVTAPTPQDAAHTLLAQLQQCWKVG